MRPTLHVITGPTAVGKTGFALDYAEARGAEIVSCDASLVYRGMDVGTAKPTRQEQARVPHHLIDLSPVDRPFDIVAYDRAAREAVEEIRERGREVVVTGGSGFYLKSFFEPVIDAVEVPPAVREEVAAIDSGGGLPALLERLREASPEGFGRLDTLNPRRVQRALERCLASGRSLPDLQSEFAKRPKPYPDWDKRLMLLEREPAELKARVLRRAEAMLEAGLVEEVERLRHAGIERNPGAASAIGYREVLAHLRGQLAEGDLLSAIVTDTLRLVKKQRTWFRTQLPRPDERRNLSVLSA